MDLKRVIDVILVRLRRGEIDSEAFVRWLRDAGMSAQQAEAKLDELIKQVEEE